MHTSPQSTNSAGNGRLPLPPIWESTVSDWLESENITVNADRFAGQIFRKKFFPILARVYFDELVVYTQQTKRLADAKAHIVEELGLHRSTMTKWSDDSYPAAADKIFAIVTLVLKKELNEIPFSNRHTMLSRAILKLMEEFNKLYGEPTQCALSPSIFRSIVHAMRSREVDHFCPDSKSNDQVRTNALEKLVRLVNEGFRRDFESYRQQKVDFFLSTPQVTPSELLCWLSDWGTAYTLVAIGTKDVSWEIHDA